MRCTIVSLFLMTTLYASAAVPMARKDYMQATDLREVRLQGVPAEKMNAFLRERMLTEFAQKEIFGEARSAFETRDDDELHAGGGYWRGEFWGKLMLSTARASIYLQDPALNQFIKEECYRMMALQDEDGYLGSYSDKELILIKPEDRPRVREAYGWYTIWNLWNRKYTIWAMFAAYKATGDEAILSSVTRQMDQWIDMTHRQGVRLKETGQPDMQGLPSMSILKPLLLLYTETGKQKYLDYAKEIVADWDVEGGTPPDFYQNARRPVPLTEWYPEPENWAKCYEMMSCLDGVLEYARVTGDERSLKTVMAIRDNLAETELNPMGSVGFCDKFMGARNRLNGITEVCDAIHWIRLNYDLFMMTGDPKYVDSMELCYFNAFLAGIYRDGTWSAFAVRSHMRHELQHQCGYAYNHCCTNNVPRTFMDIAEAVLSLDEKGTVYVNFYQDAVASIDGVKVEITGNYPVNDQVHIRITSPEKRTVKFRIPGFGQKDASWETLKIKAGVTEHILTFDMEPRIVDIAAENDPQDAMTNPVSWVRNRWKVQNGNEDIVAAYRTTPASYVMRGPLLLAKSRNAGASIRDLTDTHTVRHQSYQVSLEPVRPKDTWGMWKIYLTKDGCTPVVSTVCDYQSAADKPYTRGGNILSIWF